MEHLNKELQVLSLSEEIRSKVKTEIDDQQRDFYLRQQLKAIQEALGEDSEQQEVVKLRERLKEKKGLPGSAREVAEKELQRLEMTPSASPNYGVTHNYVEWILDLPWEEYSKDSIDLKQSQKVLDEDHYGLEKVKKRIIEYLAVLKLKQDMKAPILCFYGPPGVGKTSLGKSIARSLNREFERFSLGGIHDEAEIRGHRKTYIGAMPGRILRAMKKAGKGNPVLMLDEIDKVGADFRGDPTSALLEVLDPEQNNTFSDNYLELDYDLSKVMFIATANSLDTIPAPLRDRMEIINISGYTLEEKSAIAKRHLLPKQLKEHGLDKDHFVLGKGILDKIVEGYTRESGVRGLEKQIAKAVRYAAKSIAMEEEYKKNPQTDNLVEILGPEKVHRDLYENNHVAGVVTGLAWTSVGGDILFIESAISEGKGQLSITGNLGKVMKESATIAMEFIKSNKDFLGLKNFNFDKYNIHIHVPEGATPKDGPSAGITMLTSLVSLLTQKRVKSKLAMTGEITLRGKVLPVGGIKEKILAAKRSKIKEIILSEDNRKDIDEINQKYLRGLTFHYVKEMKEVLDIAILSKKVNDPKTFKS